jgi:hypothetical protein
MKNSKGWFLKNLKIELLYDPAIPLLDIYPKYGKSACQKRCLHSHFHCSTVHNSQVMESTKCPLTDKWIRKMYMMATMRGCCSAFEKKFCLL